MVWVNISAWRSTCPEGLLEYLPEMFILMSKTGRLEGAIEATPCTNPLFQL
jgi:hypothetical protein